jgi:UDP-GlcNAc3NAcA epimerase
MKNEMKICTIVGTRPQFIKAAVVSHAIAEFNRKIASNHSSITEVIIHTGQHYDWGMSAVFFEEMQIPGVDYSLNIHGLSHGAMTGQMLEKIEKVLLEKKPDLVIVYGDTNSTLAGALAASKLHIPVAHVEAGLRSFNRHMPEEINRVLTDHIATILFCPTRKAIELLRQEGVTNDFCDGKAPQASGLKPGVYLVGDVMLDAVLHYKQYSRRPGFAVPGKFILATIHRAENTDDSNRLQSIFQAFRKISREIPVVAPLHPRTRKMIQESYTRSSSLNFQIVEPVSYLEMLYLLERCSLVLTDSGGLQKEAYFFNKPCVTMRDETEWVELVEHGFNIVAGAESESIWKAFMVMKDKRIDSHIDLYGSGDAGRKIVNILNKVSEA